MPEIKIIKKHIHGCRALEYVDNGTWKSPWTFEAAKFGNYAGSLGRWLVFRCNMIDCPAQLVALEDRVIKQFEAGESETAKKRIRRPANA